MKFIISTGIRMSPSLLFFLLLTYTARTPPGVFPMFLHLETYANYKVTLNIVVEIESPCLQSCSFLTEKKAQLPA